MAFCPSILFVDAYDSFTQNILALLQQQFKATITLIRIDSDVETQYDVSLEQFVQKFSAIVLGPGPGDPRNGQEDTGIFNAVLEYAERHNIPTLGICLGFQSICMRYGLPIERMEQPCHGQTKQIRPFCDNTVVVDKGPSNIFRGLEHDDIQATCYNSLCVRLESTLATPFTSRPGSSSTNASFASVSSEDSPTSLSTNSIIGRQLVRVLAIDIYGNVMAVVHRFLPCWGLQFHPESCKSNDKCHQLIRNWLYAVEMHNKERRPEYVVNLVSNDRHRGNCLPLTNSLNGVRRDSEHQTAQFWSRKDLCQILVKATQFCGDQVDHIKLPFKFPRWKIAELVNAICPETTKIILESTKKGRYSIYNVGSGFNNSLAFMSDLEISNVEPVFLSTQGNSAHVMWEGQSNTFDETRDMPRSDILGALEDLMVIRRATGGVTDVPFWGGFAGYMSYENGLQSLGISVKKHQQKVPDMSFMWVERSLIFDAESSVLYVQSIRKNDRIFLNIMSRIFSQADKALEQLLAIQSTPTTVCTLSERQQSLRRILGSASSLLPNRMTYDKSFDQCQKELLKGNSYELCLTTEAQIDMSISEAEDEFYEFELYKNVHAFNPVPFGAFISFPEATIISSSPEQYMSWNREGVIDMIPMKGTVKRSRDMTLAKATEILSSPKETAENLMIADLIRHDLHSTVGYDSKVGVIKLCEIVQHETVYQLVSHIRAHAPISADLNPDARKQQVIKYGVAALRTTLPPGSMTGAPKIKSCELLQDFEDRNRGIYSGVLGFLDVGGGGCWSVCIRTAFRARSEDSMDEKTMMKKHKWHIGAGGAITVLSNNDDEWEEMQTKLTSVLRGFREVV